MYQSLVYVVRLGLPSLMTSFFLILLFTFIKLPEELTYFFFPTGIQPYILQGVYLCRISVDTPCISSPIIVPSNPDAPLYSYLEMNFYFEAAKVLDRLDAKQGSIFAIVGSLPENKQKRTAALVIETLRC
jgi:hypothetical protein